MTEYINKSKKYEQQPSRTPKEQLKFICDTFLSKKEYDSDYEIEVRFGTKGIKPLTKMDYNNVIKKLQSLGFFINNPKDQYSLKIETEFLDIKTGQFRPSNIRLEIYNFELIKEYCRTNDIELVSRALIAMKKNPVFIDNNKINSADYDDFNFRVSFAKEEIIGKNSKLLKDIFDNWARTKKGFRYINRVSLIKPGIPFRVDLSIVRTSTKENGQYIKTYNIGESNVFTNQEHYEIEIELDNKNARFMYKNSDDMIKGIEQITKNVLSGLQKTNYPVSYKEQKNVLSEYMQLTKGDQYNKDKYVNSSDFIGPSSVTLHIKNIVPINPNMNVPNIRKDFVVTDKADGERNLLFISKGGKMYLISSKMEVMFTGSKTEVSEFKYSLLDGELILHNKNKQFINLYAAFDLYFINGQDVRSFGFVSTTEKDVLNIRLRLPLLRNLVANINAVPIADKSTPTNQLRINTKRFYPIINQSERIAHKEEDMDIFDACNYILQNVQDGLYEYNTDGLIFTPSSFGVGGDKSGVTRPIKTWDYSFKWKPPHFNTIDFLITTQKSPNGGDIITPIFENGMDMLTITQFTQYKTVVLRCGFDESKHGYINPCQDVIEDKLPEFRERDVKKEKSRPVQFYPTSSYGNNAGLCNIVLEKDDTGNYQMFTKEREVIEDNAIVEFSYDLSKNGFWRWVPLRVRYDKTYPNDYKTANDNWNSIHNPVTSNMISTGENIPDALSEGDADVYYNRITNTTDTTGMRDFHNMFIKKLLIERVSKKGDTLIDYACGKGGDLPKWIASNLSFVFGIDISKDNLENRINGACARFLNFKKDFKNMPYALFVNGNSSLNIRSGEAMLNDKAIQITKAVFGQGAKENLGNGVIRQYGKGEDGFNVSSCQFAIHYMFENIRTLHNFMRNIAECTKLNGYFIGTSYDGKTIFNKLRKKIIGESIGTYIKETKIWELVKEYDDTKFEDDESCIGYKISVYQDSINKMFPEYLVNYDYLNRIMEDYGFTVLSREDAKKIGLPEGSGMFNELYNLMINETKRYPSIQNNFGDALEMTNYEKDISFLNRFFIYKKIRTVNAKKISESFISRLPDEIEFEEKQTKVFQNETKIAIQETKPKVKKLNKTILLVASSESPEVEKKSTTKTRKVTKQKIEFEII